MTKARSYSSLKALKTFEDRFEYLKIFGNVGEETFGYTREFNQYFYHSSEWQRTRSKIIVRDNGCDLALPDYEIHGRIYVHHINPITLDDIENHSDILFDPENLICVSFSTHNDLHYGKRPYRNRMPVERVPGDTCPWR